MGGGDRRGHFWQQAVYGHQDIARGIVRILLGAGTGEFIDQISQGMVANFVKRPTFGQVLHHVGKLIDALQ